MLNAELILILFIAFVFRFLQLIKNNTDDDVHYWMIDQLSKKPFQTLENANNSIRSGWMGYPILYHQLICLFPKKLRIAFARFMNIANDLLMTIFVYFAAEYFFQSYDATETYSIFSYHAYVALLFSLSPIFMPLNARLVAIGARSFSSLIAFTHFILIYLYLIDFDVIYLIAIAFSFILMIYSSQFGLQVLLFFDIIIAIYYQDLLLISSILALPILMITFKYGHLNKIIRAKFKHWAWYFKQDNHLSITQQRNRISDSLSLIIDIFKNQSKAISTIFYNNTFLISVLSVPTLYLILFLLFKESASIEFILVNSILTFSFIITISSILIFLLTSSRFLAFLGQAERYFEYSLPFISLLTVVIVLEHSLAEKYLIFLLLLQMSIIVIKILVYFRIQIITKFKKQKALDSSLNKYLQNLHEHKKIITIPTKMSFELSRHSKKHDFLFNFIYSSQDANIDYMNDDFIMFDFIRPDLKLIKDYYKADIVIYSKDLKDLKPSIHKMYVELFDKMHIAYENNKSIVYDL